MDETFNFKVICITYMIRVSFNEFLDPENIRSKKRSFKSHKYFPRYEGDFGGQKIHKNIA